VFPSEPVDDFLERFVANVDDLDDALERLPGSLIGVAILQRVSLCRWPGRFNG
jgi:hypothetical protein